MAACPVCNNENLENSNFCNQCGYDLGGGNTGKLNPDTILEGRYIIVKTIGRGGMGAVYMALDTRLKNMPVAIKEMSTRAVGGNLSAAVASFQKEAALLVSLRHPSLPVIRDFFSQGEDRWYLVMDLIDGQTLKELADQHGPIPEQTVLNWAEQLCDIISYLHSQNPPVIFRDLKPSNIMLTSQGQIKLIDFGIARHFRKGNTSDTSSYGSSGFAPPEQYGTSQTDARSDIYALGATLHYLLTGIDPINTPFQFESPGKFVSVSPKLESAIMKAVELRFEDRPETIEHLRSLLPFKRSKLSLSESNHHQLPMTKPVNTSSKELETVPLSVDELKSTDVLSDSSEIEYQTNSNLHSSLNKPNKHKRILVVTAVIIVLLFTGISGYSYLNTNRDNTPTKPPNFDNPNNDVLKIESVYLASAIDPDTLTPVNPSIEFISSLPQIYAVVRFDKAVQEHVTVSWYYLNHGVRELVSTEVISGSKKESCCAILKSDSYQVGLWEFEARLTEGESKVAKFSIKEEDAGPAIAAPPKSKITTKTTQPDLNISTPSAAVVPRSVPSSENYDYRPPATESYDYRSGD